MNKVWNAKWIGFPDCPADASPIFRKSFFCEKVTDCRIDISGLGAYVLKINGRRVSEDILQPAFSNYQKTVYYNTYDLDDYLNPGENTVEVLLGNVWYNEQQATDWQFETAVWKGTPRFVAEIFTGDRLLIKSDESWDCAVSNILFNSLRCGEHYDAAYEVIFRHKASLMPEPEGQLQKQSILPIRVSKIYTPVQVYQSACYFGFLYKQSIYDFGINLSGNVEICGRGRRGAKISIYYFERMLSNHMPDFTCLNAGLHSETDKALFQKDEYTFAGTEQETWHSEFGYNGFRYVMIEGEFEELTVTARCFHTQLDSAGDIDCDHPLIMKIHRAVKQSTLTNFHHIPTDCPHREKNGWTADAHLSAEQAYFNFDMTHAYRKWMQDFRDSQLPSGQLPCIVPSSDFGYTYVSIWPAWDGAVILIPWQMYRYTGDISHLKENYEAMHRYLHYLQGYIANGLCAESPVDWLSLLEFGEIAPQEALVTMFCGYITEIFKKISLLLGKAKNAEAAEKLYAELRQAYQDKYASLTINSQVLYAMELVCRFTDNRTETLVNLIKALETADYHITGGIFCAKYLLDALTQSGRFDLAYRVASQEDFPGWSYLIDVNSGTLGENWLGGKSGNHHMFSEIGAWYYKALAGFRIDDENPGFRHILLEPHIPDDVKIFSAWHMTPCGRLAVSWNEKEIRLEIPEQSTASFRYKQIAEELNGGIYTFAR